MYRQFMSDENLRFVTEAIPVIRMDTGIEDNPLNFWVCYGSFALGQQGSQSDLDILLVHNDSAAPARVQSSFRDHPVTIYTLSLCDFVADGKERRFGGYFSGKMLNPFVIFGENPKANQVAIKTIGDFIGPFAATTAKERGREIAKANELVADCVLAYLHLCPAYKAYFLRYYTSSNFAAMWQRMEEVLSSALKLAGSVTQLGKGLYEYNNPFSPEEYRQQLVTCVARFWAFGSCCHGCNFSFPDYYFQKAQGYVDDGRENQCTEMLGFLDRSATRRVWP